MPRSRLLPRGKTIGSFGVPPQRGRHLMAEADVISAEDFDALLEANSMPILVDFFADWCGPCKLVDGLMDEIATEHGGQVRVTILPCVGGIKL